jgi:hypothetical protein
VITSISRSRWPAHSTSQVAASGSSLRTAATRSSADHRFVGYEQLSVLVIFEKKPSS